jgi:hypothetical protein
MSKFVILDHASENESAIWVHSWKLWKEREVFAHPSYVNLFAKPGDRVLCAVQMRDDKVVIMFPFIWRPLASEKWVEPELQSYSDITSPYGYGGPYMLSANAADVEVFWQEFDAWCYTSKVVSIFARLPVFGDQVIRFRGDIVEKSLNIVRSLNLSESEMWRDYAHKVRKNVNRARREGLEVRVDSTGAYLNDFYSIYLETMTRREAKESYFFPRRFFEQIIAQLKESFFFLHVFDGTKMISTELVLVSANNIYSYLGGTRSDTFDKRPNDLLKHEIVLWGLNNQKKNFVLGGGYQGQDGIFVYKRYFAPKGEVPFRVATRVLDHEASSRLIRARETWALNQESEWSPVQGFFPPYRS